MFKYVKTAAVMAALALLAAACGGGDGDADTTTTAAAPATTAGGSATDTTAAETTETTAVETTETSAAPTTGMMDVSVGLVYDIGGRGDGSFNDAAAAGLDRAKEELGADTSESSANEDGTNREELLALQADEGKDVVIGVGFLFADPMTMVASEYPETYFAIVDSVVDAPNVAGLTFAEEQGSFLVGVAAALKTESNRVGFLGGVDMPLIHAFEAGFVAGVMAVDPSIEIVSQYITQPPDFAGFNDPAAGKVVSQTMYESGADIIYHAAGGSGNGTFQAAKDFSEAGGSKVWAIGVDSDQYNTAGEELRPYILTSMLKRVDVAVFNTIKAVQDGMFQGGPQTFDLSVDGVGYSTSGGFVDDIAGQLEEWKSRIVSGEVVVSRERGEGMTITEVNPTPGEGVSLKMARANWSTGYFQAALYRALLQELGYEVSDPADLELGPSLAYLAMAEGNADFWVNSWYPIHNSWLLNDLPDGSQVGDHVSAIGAEMPAGGLQGYLITKSFAEKHGITTLDDLNDNPAAIAEYDAQDTNSGNGVAEIYGCPESWTCDDIIQSQIAFSGWDNIDQVLAGYDAMFAEAVAKANDGAPMVAYTWTPSSYIAQLRPGDNVVWVAVEDVLDDSNPLGRDGGEEWDQRPGIAGLSPESCPDAAERGTCQLGWVAADILVTARNDLLVNHPAAAELFDVVELNVVDVSLQVVSQEGGSTPEELAVSWIAENRAKVDEWLTQARAAA